MIHKHILSLLRLNAQGGGSRAYVSPPAIANHILSLGRSIHVDVVAYDYRCFWRPEPLSSVLVRSKSVSSPICGSFYE